VGLLTKLVYSLVYQLNGNGWVRDDDKNWAAIKPEDAVNKVVEKIAQEFIIHIESKNCIPVANLAEDLTSLGLDNVVRKLAAQLAKMNISPFIVLDNGDLFFYKNSRYRFFEPFARQLKWNLEDTFVALANRFTFEGQLGKIGASLLFVCRPYVYLHCSAIQNSATDPTGTIRRREHTAYQISNFNSYEVIDSRIRLLDEAVQILGREGARQAEMFKKDFEYIKNQIAVFKQEPIYRNRSMLRTLWDLSHQGHRSLISFLGLLPVDTGPNAIVTKRVFDSPNLLLRLYLSNLRKKYSQKEGHFPNLFLNDAHILPDKTYPESRSPHIHSYWLKYLLLRWFQKEKRRDGQGSAKSEDVIQFFKHELNYEEDLVRLALGSLSDPSNSGCLKMVDLDLAIEYSEWLQITPRGEILVDEDTSNLPLCFDFTYLQIITDDYLLALPKCVADTIFVDADLGFSLLPGLEYAKGARDLLHKKIPAALTFFRVLVLSFDLEAKHRGNLSTLQKYGLVPNFKTIEEQLLDSIARIDERFSEDAMTEPMPNPREEWKKIIDNDEIEKTLSEYYQNPVSVDQNTSGTHQH